MAQFAAHIATGIYTGDLLRGSRELRYGLVLGSFMPDLDFVPLMAFYLVDPTLARSFHRYASHSLFIPPLILAASMGGYLLTRRQGIRAWGIGLAVGLVSHVVLDIVFWFDQVTILWPLDLWGISTTVDLWQGYEPPQALYLLLGPAAEFLFYGLLFLLLRRRVWRFEVPTTLVPALRKMEMLAFVTFGVAVLLIAILERSTYEEVVYGVAALAFAPVALYLLWRLRAVLSVGTTGYG